MAQSYVKCVLSTGKVVYLREMKISDTEKAAQKVAKRSDGDPLMLQVLMPKELLKSLLSKVAEKEGDPVRDLSATEKEDMDSLFKMVEFGQLMKVVTKMSGGDEAGNELATELIQLG